MIDDMISSSTTTHPISLVSGTIPVDAYGFKRGVIGASSVSVSTAELACAAAHMGDASMFPVLGSTPRSYIEMMWRRSMVLSAVELEGGRWFRTTAYDNLDASEKSAVSYFLGMVQGTVIAQKLLGTPYLVHVDAVLKALKQQTGKKRPDLVGYSTIPTTKNAMNQTRLWLEAKGRSTTYDSEAIDSALVQLGKRKSPKSPPNQALQFLGTPTIRVALECYFDMSFGRGKPSTHYWRTHLEDPPSNGNGIFPRLSDDMYCSIIDYVHYSPVIGAVKWLKEAIPELVKTDEGWVRATLPGEDTVLDISDSLWQVFEGIDDAEGLTEENYDALTALRNNGWAIPQSFTQPAQDSEWWLAEQDSPVRYWMKPLPSVSKYRNLSDSQ